MSTICTTNLNPTKHTMDSNVVPITQGQQADDVSMPEFVVMKFADSKIPVFKESRNKDYIKYGDDNKYPDYLTYLFNKSAKHSAIVSGKAFYIFGEGFENGDMVVNRLGDTLNDISKKAILDIELYAGFRWEVIWNAAGKVKEVYHIDYTTIRVGKNGGYYFKENWDVLNRDEEIYIPAFNPGNPVGSQVYAYNEYRPKTRYYPLPEYIGSNNFIETDIEISKYYLSAIRNGMTPSKMIQFFKGEPSEDKKREIEKRMSMKFSGAENAGKFLLVFNDSNATNPVQVDDLSATDLDKHMIELNKTCQQEIFSGHRVTSPMLFGIKTEGQLGGNTEMKAAYELFQATYSIPKANAFEKEVTHLFSFSSQPVEYKLRPTDPIGWQIPESLIAQAVTPDDVREKLGLPIADKPTGPQGNKTLLAISGVSPLVANKILEKLTDNEIRGLAGLAPIAGGDAILGPDGMPVTSTTSAPTLDTDEPPVNPNLKDLTIKQLNKILSISAKYQRGVLTYNQALLFIQGYGLTAEDAAQFLVTPTEEEPLPQQPSAMAAVELTEEETIDVFDEYGENKEDYEILKSKKVCFTAVEEAAEDEEVYIQEAFKTLDITQTEKAILDLIKKDPKITPDVIATAIKQTKKYVTSKLGNMVKRGIIETAVEAIGADEIVSRIIPDAIDLKPPTTKNPPVSISVMYSYEVKPGVGPDIIPTTRPFCVRMIKLNRLYTRADIEKISARLGYSVWDRKGGWWGNSPECRHRWQSNIVVKKK